MACHRRHVNVPSRVAPGHGEPCGRSQADTRPSANFCRFVLEALRRQRAVVAGHRWQVDRGWNESEARKVQEQAGAGTSDHCGVPKPTDPQADRPGGAKARRQSCLRFVAAPLFDRGEFSLEHRAKSDRQFAFRCDVSAST
ncbi:unnamed protein product [Sphagnum jensenii]|uniref:Uncharacterized protein n=1 Tax=Sphagnum jensenii TaxID=128206 RepID=A0ABP0VZT9_9BRYO